jgi:hypothetical protein
MGCSTINHNNKSEFSMPTTTKAAKVALAKKNAEAEKAKKKALRDVKAKTAAPAGKPGKKGASLVNQSKTKKK